MVHPRMNIKGGGERVAIHSLLAGLKEGHKVTLVSENFDLKDFEDFFGLEDLLASVNQITYPAFKPYLTRGLLLYQRLAYHQRHIRDALSKRRDFDLILGTQDIGYVPNLSTPMIQYCYFPEYFTHLEARPGSFLWKLYYGPASRYYRQRVNRVERFLAVSNFTRNFIAERWGRNSETLYPPCPVETYSTPVSPKSNVAITVGRLVPEKRMHLFVEMARRLPRYKFVIVGSLGSSKSPHYVSLARNAPDNVSIVLSPLRKEKDLLARAKVYVHCAENEHFGITIVEAMAAGCVPVVHDSGGPREIVSDDVGFRWHGVDQAVGQISRVMEDDGLRQVLSEKSAARSAQYNADAFETRLVRIFSEYA